MNAVIIYTDGACKVKFGYGGWGASLTYKGQVKEIFGAERDTTNNRMELMGAIMALETLTQASKVLLHSDSTYVIKGISEWLPGWKKKGWKTASKEPVKNEDLWRRLDNASKLHQIEWKWVKGHAGNEGNERADALANQAISEMLELDIISGGL